jgi:ubiquinone/menaquinone biosynthesis C-methylase UbiE
VAAVARVAEPEKRQPAAQADALRADLPRFDRVAHLYQAMEYLSFGPALERCRFHFIPALTQCRRALVLGDGDGRFLARLLTAASQLHADAVDASGAMLRLLKARIEKTGAAPRLTTIRADARCFNPPDVQYDLVATHFFLDCLTEQEADALVAGIRSRLAPGARWVISEFQIPAGGWFQTALARGIIAFLYAAFRTLTGLRVRRIPPWHALLERHGFQRGASRTWLGGLLVSELWELKRATVPAQETLPLEVKPKSETKLQAGLIPGIDPGPQPFPDPPPMPTPDPAPGPAPEPDPEPYPGPIPAPQPVTRGSIPAA